MKFHIGDFVKIKEGLNVKNMKELVTDMEQYCGKEARVTELRGDYYILDIDKEEWYWSDDMLEPSPKKSYKVVVDKNKITVTDDSGKEGTAKCCPKDKFDLATGISIAIGRMKWKPEEGKLYYSIDFAQKDNTVAQPWNNDIIDKTLYEKNLVFKTAEEAQKVAEKILNFIK